MSDTPTQAVPITFPNGNVASLVVASPEAEAAAILQALGIAPPALVLMLFGGAEGLDAATTTKLRETLGRAVFPAVATRRGLILSGGTHAGVMAIAGELAARQPEKPILLGVTPVGKAKYPGGPDLATVKDAADLDPDHTHFVLSPTDDWGSESKIMFALAHELARTGTVVAVVAGGGDHTKAEVLLATRAGWPVVVLAQSGGVSEQLTRLNDPEVRDIAARADLRPLAPEATLEDFEQILETQRDRRGLLLDAWGRFRDCDGNARRLQKVFGRLQSSILICGIIGIVLVAVQTHLKLTSNAVPPGTAASAAWDHGLHIAIVIIPVLTAVLLGISHQFRPGDKWILLRGSAEAIKREIFRYRAGAYSQEELRDTSAEAHFAERLNTITERLFQSDVSRLGLKTYAPEPGDPSKASGQKRTKKVEKQDHDDRLSRLSSDRYLVLRVENQLRFYAGKIRTHGARLFWFSTGSLVIGGSGTAFAAVKLEPWIAVTTAVAAALTTYLKYYQTEETLVKYNQARADLTAVKAWWAKFSVAEKRAPQNQAQLVDLTERVLEQETAGWSQRMIDALSEMRQAEADRAEQQREKKKAAEAKN